MAASRTEILLFGLAVGGVTLAVSGSVATGAVVGLAAAGLSWCSARVLGSGGTGAR